MGVARRFNDIPPLCLGQVELAYHGHGDVVETGDQGLARVLERHAVRTAGMSRQGDETSQPLPSQRNDDIPEQSP